MLTFCHSFPKRQTYIYIPLISESKFIDNNPSCKEKVFKPNQIRIYPCDVIDLIPIIYDYMIRDQIGIKNQ